MTKLRYKLMQDLLCGRKHPKILPSHLHLTHNHSTSDLECIDHAGKLGSCSAITPNLTKCKALQESTPELQKSNRSMTDLKIL